MLRPSLGIGEPNPAFAVGRKHRAQAATDERARAAQMPQSLVDRATGTEYFQRALVRALANAVTDGSYYEFVTRIEEPNHTPDGPVKHEGTVVPDVMPKQLLCFNRIGIASFPTAR
jgi:hypothetical protein